MFKWHAGDMCLFIVRWKFSYFHIYEYENEKYIVVFFNQNCNLLNVLTIFKRFVWILKIEKKNIYNFFKSEGN